MTLEERITRLEDIEAIRSLQARYQRCLDTRAWEDLALCFTEDATSAYDQGNLSYRGRDAVIEFLRRSLTHSIVCSHLIHGGEIDFVDSCHATGIWTLEDYLLHRRFLLKMHGVAYYNVDYIKQSGQWQIARIGYERNYQYFERRPLLNLFTLATKTHSQLQETLR